MGTIKFRGMRVDNGEWVYGYYSKWKDGARMSHVILEIGDGLTKDDMTKWYVKADTVGEFTGLKDKNGVDIYGGDQLKSEYRQQTITIGIGDSKYLGCGVDIYGVYADFGFKKEPFMHSSGRNDWEVVNDM